MIALVPRIADVITCDELPILALQAELFDHILETVSSQVAGDIKPLHLYERIDHVASVDVCHLLPTFAPNTRRALVSAPFEIGTGFHCASDDIGDIESVDVVPLNHIRIEFLDNGVELL